MLKRSDRDIAVEALLTTKHKQFNKGLRSADAYCALGIIAKDGYDFYVPDVQCPHNSYEVTAVYNFLSEKNFPLSRIWGLNDGTLFVDPATGKNIREKPKSFQEIADWLMTLDVVDDEDLTVPEQWTKNLDTVVV